MEIQINSHRRMPGLRKSEIRRRLKRVLDDLAFHEGELSILLTTDDHISELNRRYRGHEGPTNVLAFPMSEGPDSLKTSGILGDIAISMDTAIREAEEAGETLEDTLDRLLIHGLLHLMDFDHEGSLREARRMRREERRLQALVRGPGRDSRQRRS